MKQIFLPGLRSFEGELKVSERSSLLCFLFRPPEGAGSAAKTLVRLLELPSPAAGSNLPGDRETGERLEEELSTGALLETLNSDSCNQKERAIIADVDCRGMIICAEIHILFLKICKT